MIGTIRHHQKILWAVIITAIIFSFVIFFTPNIRMDSFGEYKDDFGSINRRPITREEYLNAQQETQLFYMLRYGQWPESEQAMKQAGFDLQQETYNRIILTEKLKQMRVEPSVEAVAKWISDIFSSGSNQPFSVEHYNTFVKERLWKHGLVSEDFQRFAQHEVGRQHLIGVFGIGGRFITAKDAEFLYRRENRELSTEVALFPLANFQSGITVDDAMLQGFYTTNQAEYRLPQRVQVNYVKWDLTNYYAEADKRLADITNLTQQLEYTYNRQGADFYKDTNGVPLPKEAALDRIKELFREDSASTSARKKASEFLGEIVDSLEKDPKQVSLLEKKAAEKGLTVESTAPFDEDMGPAEFRATATFLRAAFALTYEEPIHSSALICGNAVYAISLKKIVPSEIPKFDDIRAQVSNDYRRNVAMIRAREAARTFQGTLTNSLAQGKTYDETCQAAQVSSLKLPPFSTATRSLPEIEGKANFNMVKDVAFGLEPQKASDVIPTRDGAFIVYLRARLPVDAAKMNKEMPGYVQRLREVRQMASFAEWFQKQAQEMNLLTPAAAAPKNTNAPAN